MALLSPMRAVYSKRRLAPSRAAQSPAPPPKTLPPGCGGGGAGRGGVSGGGRGFPRGRPLSPPPPAPPPGKAGGGGGRADVARCRSDSLTQSRRPRRFDGVADDVEEQVEQLAEV